MARVFPVSVAGGKRLVLQDAAAAAAPARVTRLGRQTRSRCA